MGEKTVNLTLRQRKRLQQAGAEQSPKSKRRHLWVLLSFGLILLLAAGSVWAWNRLKRGSDPRLKEIASLEASMAKIDDPKSKEGRTLFQQMRQKMDALPEDLRAQAMRNGPQAMQQRLAKFFTMSHNQQLAELDKRIGEIQRMEAARKAGDMSDGPPPGFGGPSAPGGPPGASGPPSGPGGPGGSDTQHVQRKQSMLSNIPPEQRAQFNLFRQMLDARMQQQGVPAPHGPF